MITHPAKYSDAILRIFNQLLPNGTSRILDPFGGTGKLRDIRPHAIINELEPEWALLADARGGNGTTVGNALHLPYCNASFDAICCSPTYANRMADAYDGRDGSRRNTYRIALGRELHPENSGGLQWGSAYRAFHELAWRECWRVLRPNGKFVLNVSNHIRGGREIGVTDWHREALHRIGFWCWDTYRVSTPRNRCGTNGDARVEYESVILFEKPGR